MATISSEQNFADTGTGTMFKTKLTKIQIPPPKRSLSLRKHTKLFRQDKRLSGMVLSSQDSVINNISMQIIYQCTWIRGEA